MKLSSKLFKGLYGALAGLGVLGIVLFVAICFIPVIAAIYGVVLAFKASIVLGILSLFVEPAFMIYGLVMLFGGVNIPEQIMEWFHHLN